ncbi:MULTISPECIES: hypothetical protein [unclassified Rhizobium]|uniref:hypothetical protein n=1 Tax=unclassified Rhizobium TaxID=2613769 RepID=UPI000CF254CF|nr:MULTISPECIES: hypothetical protein [Rhizobium]MDK4738374.1 hypothetical protein [Rhizobium sp. CNPSo 3464]UWU19995.1 hypothetical protein N2601_11845 [Rhizobium tropici]
MIEFALLFGLGFLTAAFLVFLIAPAVHRRIVWFTEKRLKATMPLSPQEVRAQKDMARALFAAENARTEQALTQERDKSVALQIHNGKLQQEAGRFASENSELRTRIDDLEVEAGELRSRLRREESYISQLKSGIHTAEQVGAEKDADIDGLRKRMTKMAADADNLKIDLATRETEIESLKFRIKTLRDERDTLRQDLNLASLRAKDAELRLGQESDKAQHLEERLDREIAGNADKETAIERHVQDVARLKEKLETAHAEAEEAGRALQAAGLAPQAKPMNGSKPSTKPRIVDIADHDTNAAEPERNVEDDIAQMTEEVRNRAAALSDRLLKSRSPSHDQAMREEIANIAANMVAMTALKEGEKSPIFDLLPKETSAAEQGARISLADRAAALLPKQQ